VLRDISLLRSGMTFSDMRDNLRNMITCMAKTATLLLTHTPSDERVDEIVEEIVSEYGPNYGHVSWFVSEKLPPFGRVDVRDQLEAHQRDLPGSVFLTVIMESSKD
jgi:hypothetical protein